MKYAIVYLIKGEPKKYQQKLIKTLAKISNEGYLIDESPIPEHVTLIYPFESNKIKKLEDKLNKISKKTNVASITIKEFGNFHKKVAFLKVLFSKEAKKMQKKILYELENEFLLEKYKNFNHRPKPHTTLAYGNTKETFNIIWSYLKSVNKPNFILKFNNITILKKPKGKHWQIHKEFKLK